MPLLAPIIDIRLNDGSGTVAVDRATTAANGAYVGSPTLTADSGAYTADDPIPCFSGFDATKYVDIPPDKIPISGDWTITFQIRARGAASGSFPFCKLGMSSAEAAYSDEGDGVGAAWRWKNAIVFYLRGTHTAPTTNAISAAIYANSVANPKHVSVTTSGDQFDGDVHRVTLVYSTAGSGTLTLYLDGTAGTAVTSASGALPTVAGHFGIGCVLKGENDPSTAMGDASFPFDVFGFKVFAQAVDPADFASLDDQYNGNPNLPIEDSDRERWAELLGKAQTRPVIVLTAPDSNGARNTVTRAGKLDQGHFVTISRMLKRALGTDGLLGMVIGCNSSLQVDTGGDNASPERGWLGIQQHNALLGTYVTNHAIVPSWVMNRHLGEWNYIDEGGNNPDGDSGHGWLPNDGFVLNARYIASGSSMAAGTGSRLLLDGSHPDWPFSPTANIKIAQTFGGSGTCYPHLNVGGTLYPSGAPARAAGTAAWDSQANVVAAGSAISGTIGTYSLAKSGGSVAGPLAAGPVLIYDASKTSGFIFAPMWIKGAYAGAHLTAALADPQTRRAKVAACVGELAQTVYQLSGKRPVVLFLWQNGGNDFVAPNTLLDSYDYEPAYDEDGEFTGEATITADSTNLSGTLIGHRQNMKTTRGIIRDGYLGCGLEGVDPDDFYFVMGPYHRGSDTVVAQQRQIKARAEREIRDAYPDSMRLDGLWAVSKEQFGSAKGYAADGEAHGSYDGFSLLGDTLGDLLHTLLPSSSSGRRFLPIPIPR